MTYMDSRTTCYVQHGVELNARNPNQVCEPDYERRLNSYKQVVNAQDTNEYLCVFYCCLYELEHSVNNLSLREYASQCLHRFLKQSQPYQDHLLTEIRHLASLIDVDVDHEDLKLDFFENIAHVQIRRRLRELQRLKTIHDEHAFRSTTIDHYLLPIVCSFINDMNRSTINCSFLSFDN